MVTYTSRATGMAYGRRARQFIEFLESLLARAIAGLTGAWITRLLGGLAFTSLSIWAISKLFQKRKLAREAREELRRRGITLGKYAEERMRQLMEAYGPGSGPLATTAVELAVLDLARDDLEKLERKWEPVMRKYLSDPRRFKALADFASHVRWLPINARQPLEVAEVVVTALGAMPERERKYWERRLKPDWMYFAYEDLRRWRREYGRAFQDVLQRERRMRLRTGMLFSMMPVEELVRRRRFDLLDRLVKLGTSMILFPTSRMDERVKELQRKYMPHLRATLPYLKRKAREVGRRARKWGRGILPKGVLPPRGYDPFAWAMWCQMNLPKEEWPYWVDDTLREFDRIAREEWRNALAIYTPHVERLRREIEGRERR